MMTKLFAVVLGSGVLISTVVYANDCPPSYYCSDNPMVCVYMKCPLLY